MREQTNGAFVWWVNSDYRKQHCHIQQLYIKDIVCGNILHTAVLGCLQAVDDNGVITCLLGKAALVMPNWPWHWHNQ